MSGKKKETPNNKSVAIFEDQPVRRVWNKKDSKWYFSIVDVVRVLTDSLDPSGYLKDMRRRDSELSKGWGQIATPLSIETKEGGSIAMSARKQLEEQTGKRVVSTENFLSEGKADKRKRIA